MSDSKTFASLSPTLLARKGVARPAMRPQMQHISLEEEVEPEHANHDDLGWNDMGHGSSGAEVISIVPEVIRKQKALAQALAAKGSTDRSRRSALSDGRRAAFTLRVDAQRHLKLRMACTLSNRSAQQLVTEALDHLLDGLPDVTSLAAQVAKKR
jgi:hypothetical protein